MRVSDELLLGNGTVHLIKNTESGQSFKVGTKEHFLISRMDGSRSLDEIGAEYAARYGRRLSDANWQQLLGMLGTRGLLAGAPPRPRRRRPTQHQRPNGRCCAARCHSSPTRTRPRADCTTRPGSC